MLHIKEDKHRASAHEGLTENEIVYNERVDCDSETIAAKSSENSTNAVLMRP
jgi:hypothetical protein